MRSKVQAHSGGECDIAIARANGLSSAVKCDNGRRARGVDAYARALFAVGHKHEMSSVSNLCAGRGLEPHCIHLKAERE
eukprot:4359828-Prymnesium_polylepis.1